jgi:hypothetical protein
VGTEFNIHDEEYRTEPDVETSDIVLKAPVSNFITDKGFLTVHMHRWALSSIFMMKISEISVTGLKDAESNIITDKGQDSQTAQQEQDIFIRTARTGQPGHDSQDGTARTDRAPRTGQPGQDAREGQPGRGIQDRTSRTGRPGKDSQDRASRT